eukprot:1927884-Prymnesium_polylepis.1
MKKGKDGESKTKRKGKSAAAAVESDEEREEGGAGSSSASDKQGGRRAWAVHGWLAHIGVPDLLAEALLEG